jgi:hypothetical protein
MSDSKDPGFFATVYSARALGLGGSIFNMPMVGHKDDICDLLTIPDNYEVTCIVPLGYPADKHGPLKRRPVSEVVFLDDFGEAWDFAVKQPGNGWENRWL